MEIDFRKFDCKWYLIENKKNIKRIIKLFGLQKSKYPILIYTFIDEVEGPSALILGNILVDNKKPFLDKEMFEEDLFIIRYRELLEFEIKEVSNNVIKEIKNSDLVIELIKDNFYTGNEKVQETRKYTYLDEYRDETIIDQVTITLIDKNKNKEEAEVKLVEKLNGDDFRVRLLEDTDLDFGVVKDEFFEVKYVERPNFTGLIYLKHN